MEPNHSSPVGLAQYQGSGSSQFLNTLGRRGNPSVSVMDWACAVIAPANTIAPTTMDVIDGFISGLASRPFFGNEELNLAGTRAQSRSIEYPLRSCSAVRLPQQRAARSVSAISGGAD